MVDRHIRTLVIVLVRYFHFISITQKQDDDISAINKEIEDLRVGDGDGGCRTLSFLKHTLL